MLFVEVYFDQGRPKQRAVETIGYIDEFTHLYDDPVAHFKQVAKERTNEQQERQKTVVIELLPEAILPFDRESGSYFLCKEHRLWCHQRCLLHPGHPEVL